MSVPLVTRRGVLATVTAALGVAIAGCGERAANDSDDVRPPVEAPGETTDFEAFELRSADARQFVSLYDETAERYRERGRFVISGDDVPDVRIESVSDADAAAARSFVTATDFERESVFVEHHPIEEDGGRTIRSITVERDRFELEYCQDGQPPWGWTQALFLRVPYPYPEQPSRYGSSGTSRCPDGAGIEPKRP